MKRSTFGLLGVLALLGLLWGSGPTRAELKFYRATSVALTLSSNPLQPGEPLSLTGCVKDNGGRPVRAGQVFLELAEAPEGPWMVLDRGEVDEGGCLQTTDYSLGLETGPRYVRARYGGADNGPVCLAEAVSPVLPLRVSAPGEKAGGPSVGWVAAEGDGGPEGVGPWQFVLRVKAGNEAGPTLLQVSPPLWGPWKAAVLDWETDAGWVTVGVPEGGEEARATWHLEELAAGEEVTLRLVVDGLMAMTEEEGEASLPLEAPEP
jgi:hypothetical protein